jgi:hypothetical protein
MAKAVTKTKEAEAPKAQPPAVVGAAGGVPAYLAARLAASEGRGVSTARDDNIVPLLLVLQKSSPQTDERADTYVKGAKAGELWVRGTDKIISGTEGIEVQPCAFWKGWLEWGPKRGDGFKGRHNERPDDAFEKEVLDDQGRPQIVWARPNNNILVETREHYVLVGADAYVIPFSSTGHTVSRTWMQLMNQFRDQSGKPLDSFARKYRLTTVRKEKDGNSWYVIKAVDAGWVESAQQYDLGLALYQAVMSGEKVAEAVEEDSRGEPERSPRTSDAEAEKVGI